MKMIINRIESFLVDSYSEPLMNKIRPSAKLSLRFAQVISGPSGNCQLSNNFFCTCTSKWDSGPQRPAASDTKFDDKDCM